MGAGPGGGARGGARFESSTRTDMVRGPPPSARSSRSDKQQQQPQVLLHEKNRSWISGEGPRRAKKENTKCTQTQEIQSAVITQEIKT